jgi:hypothetical protein
MARMPTRRMTLREYARHRGCQPSAVSAALESGRLTGWSCRRSPDGRTWEIDPDRADEQWQANTYPEWGGDRRGSL